MTKSVVWLLRLVIAIAILPALAGMVAAQDYRFNDGHLLEHPKDVVGFTFSADGKTIATVCRDEDIRVWDVESGKEKCKLPGGVDSIYPLGFADTNTLVITRHKVDAESLEKTPLESALEVWDLTTHKVKRTIVLSTKESGAIGMASGSSIAAVGNRAKDKIGVDLWDVTKGEKVGHLAQDDEPQGYAFTHDGKIMALKTKKVIHVWDITARKEKVQITLSGQPDGFALAPDGKTLFVNLASNTNESIVLYDIPGGKLQHTSKETACAYNCMGCSSDGKVLVTGVWAGAMLLDTSDGKLFKSYTESSFEDIRLLRTSPQGNYVATLQNKSKVVRLWKLEEKK